MKISILLFSFLTILSCEKKSGKINVANSTSQKISGEIGISPPPVYLDTLKTSDEIIQHISKRTDEVKTFLKTSKPQEADELYDNFKKENDSALVLLARKNPSFEEHFSEFIDYDEAQENYTRKIPDSLKKTVADFEKAGVEFWEIGEGFTELRMNPDFYYSLFNGKLSPDYQSYLDMITAEDKVLFSGDASIGIPWRDVARRIEMRDDFLKKFPNSKLKDKVKQEIPTYQYAYLGGYDNTPTFDRKSENSQEIAFSPENLKEFRRFIKENPDSETTAMIKEMLSRKFTADQFYEWRDKKIDFHW